MVEFEITLLSWQKGHIQAQSMSERLLGRGRARAGYALPAKKPKSDVRRILEAIGPARLEYSAG